MQNALAVLQTSDPNACVAVRAFAPQIGRGLGRRWLLAAIMLSLLTGFSPAAQRPTLPKFAEVEAAVEKQLASDPDHQADDLLTRSQVRAALEAARQVGWDMPHADRIGELALADDSFIVSELSSPAGRKFMRKIARHPGGYARLDRLSTIARGQKVVRDLIRQRDGDKFIEYLATTKSGQNLGGMLANAPQGVDLNKPTGRIYTTADLIAVLRRVYETSAQRAEGPR